MFKNRSVDVHQFAMVPRADIPRSTFNIQHTHKTTFNAGYLVPVLCMEILPGDSFRLSMTAFTRLATPIFPVMDNLHMDSFFFFVPNRLVWDNWKRFMGEQDNPADSISYVIPQVVSAAGGFPVASVFDFFGLPTVGQIGAGNTVSVNALPFRGWNLIYNEWFRDENLQNSAVVNKGNGPDTLADYSVWQRGKRHDYFTGCLPWPQKGTAVGLPLGTSAPVTGSGPPLFVGAGGSLPAGTSLNSQPTTGAVHTSAVPASADTLYWHTTNLIADLSAATSATINSIRLAFQTQRLLERDARGGTRYTELVRSHFGVISPDARQQRPEYLGGGSAPVTINPIAQTSATDIQGSTTPAGTLAAMGTGLMRGHGFSASFTEHGYLFGIVNVRADLTYQQGIHRMWSRSTRYDFYFPVFSMLGEQAVLNKEIYATGGAADTGVFGYQERWAEYRYHPSQISCLFRSTAAGTIDPWHLAQRFTALPVLNNSFIVDTPPVERILAVGAAANGMQFLFDSFFDIKATRPMPLYSVPGMIDHF